MAFTSVITLKYRTDQGAYTLVAGQSDFNFQFEAVPHDHSVKLVIMPLADSVECSELVVQIEFTAAVQRWRAHDYSWVDCRQDRIANDYAPKVLQLSNGDYVLAGQNFGCWEMNKGNPATLLWVLHAQMLRPVFYFSPHRVFYEPLWNISDIIELDLLCTRKSPVEWSRSPIPFSAIFCITDHCDFDSLLFLQKQRTLLQECGIRISKGIFLYHFSKREENASFEDSAQKKELLEWKATGHELFYHSLSQSIKPGGRAWEDFQHFQTPAAIAPIMCWVDHGYQPYNLTMQEGAQSQLEWLEHSHQKGIRIFWNYYDTFEDAGTINQIDADFFCPKNVFNQPFSFSEKLRLLLYYHSPEHIIYAYQQWAGTIKLALKKRSPSQIKKVVFSTLAFTPEIIRQLFVWILNNEKKSSAGRYAPLIFNLPSTRSDQHLFQTLAIKNWNRAFSDNCLQDFIHKSGCCIAHTYLSSQEKHHPGRLFSDSEGNISTEVQNSWKRMGKYIAEGKVWNPTISELSARAEMFSQVRFSLDEAQEVIYHGPAEISVRKIDA